VTRGEAIAALTGSGWTNRQERMADGSSNEVFERAFELGPGVTYVVLAAVCEPFGKSYMLVALRRKPSRTPELMPPNAFGGLEVVINTMVPIQGDDYPEAIARGLEQLVGTSKEIIAIAATAKASTVPPKEIP